MLDQPRRVEAFKAEIAEMALPDRASGRERLLLRAGAGLMALGVFLAPVAYLVSHGTTNALQQRDAQVLAAMGVIFAVVGGALFLRYSLAQFLRFWLARLSWEQQAQTDRVVDALSPEPDRHQVDSPS
jgi:predicted deacetylase